MRILSLIVHRVAGVADVAAAFRVRSHFHGGHDAGGLLPHRRTEVRRDHLARSRRERRRWAGSRTQLIDETNLGQVPIRGARQEDGTLLYSRGFASVYGEWETTANRKPSTEPSTSRCGSRGRESRSRDAAKRQKPTTASRQSGRRSRSGVALRQPRPARSTRGRVWPVFDQRTRREKVDLLVIGEGYTAPRCRSSTRREAAAAGALRAGAVQEPPLRFQRARARPAVGRERHQPAECRSVQAHAAVGGVQHLRLGAIRADARQPRAARRRVRGAVRVHRDPGQRRTYGGGGIFNDQATASVDSAFSPYVFVHEFGHHFAALADEYYTSDVAYETGAAGKPEPWEPNVTALHDPAQLKWKRSRHAGTPLPTPWDKAEFENTPPRSSSAAARFARATRPKRRWTRSSASSRRGTRSSWRR
jgi:hypothetical protein